jgi:hypothetical protein
MTPAKPSSPSANTLGKTVAPLVTMGATWGARKAMVKGYESATGKPAPVISSREAGLLQKMLWAAALGAVVALVQSTVWHYLERGTE